MKVLVINPGSTSTKLAIYRDGRPVWMSGAHHPVHELNRFATACDQYEYRMQFIRKRIADSELPIKFDAVIARGGLLKPLEGGVCRVNELMKHDLRQLLQHLALAAEFGYRQVQFRNHAIQHRVAVA